MYINNTLGNRNGVSDPLSLTAKKAMFFGLLVFGFQIQYQGTFSMLTCFETLLFTQSLTKGAASKKMAYPPPKFWSK